MRWPEFALLVVGLMSCDSRVRAVFAPPEPDQPAEDSDERGVSDAC